MLKSLLNRMTLDEKIAQFIQLASHFHVGSNAKGDNTGPMAELGISKEIVQNSGSVIGASEAKEIVKIQETYLGKTIDLKFLYYLWLILSMDLNDFSYSSCNRMFMGFGTC